MVVYLISFPVIHDSDHIRKGESARNASFHRGRDSEGLMDAREAVVHEVHEVNRERMDSLALCWLVTYMLIAHEIKRLCDHGRLFLVQTLDWRDSQERAVYVARDLHQFLTHQSANPATNADRRRLQRLFDRFISGQAITVAFKRNIRGSDIKRLSPKGAEVWEFKVQTKLQLRVFGRFAQTDMFIALTGPVDRPNCDYKAAIIRCQQEWHNLLPEHSPIHGSTINDYVSTKGIPL